MTVFVADIASYQKGLTPSALLAAGFTGVNVKLSHGMGQKSVAADAHLWLADDRFTHCTFHYLTGEASGAAQAGYAYTRMVEMGGPPGWAHAVDCEADATLGVYLEYVDTMATLLRRPIITYTGRWWWVPRGWTGAPASPWLWAAPTVGYLSAYPGDGSGQWTAGYGGWADLAAMQYSVAPIGGVAVSQTAIRSETMWRMMRGEVPVTINSLPASTSLLAEIDTLAPNRSRASDGTIGDSAHAQDVSDHNPDETGDTGSASDTDSIDEVHARDVTAAGPWPGGWLAENIVQIILARCRAGLEPRVRYLIYNRRIWTRNNEWKQEAYLGANPHDKHFHVSFMYGSGSSLANPENITAPWGILTAYEAEQDMDEAGVIAALNKWAGVGFVNNIVPAPNADDPKRSVVSALRDSRLGYEWVLKQVSPAVAALKLELDGLTVTVDVPALAAAIAAQLPPVSGGITPEQVEDALRNVLRFGIDAPHTP
jgi:hypothetical protein